jgi:hypothetical protein
VSCLYWPDFDCTPETRAIEATDTVHVHDNNEHRLALAFDAFDRAWTSGAHAGGRYHCFRGPGGLVRGVVN